MITVLNLPEPAGVDSVAGFDSVASFEEFVKERYSRLVMTVRVIVSDKGVAEDVVQETFARAYLAWPKIEGGNPAGWVHRVAFNLAISWRRRAAREMRAVAKLGRRVPLFEPAPEVYPELHREVAALPKRQKMAVALHYTLGCSVLEASEIMKCRPGTVKSLLFQARERLRDRLGEQ